MGADQYQVEGWRGMTIQVGSSIHLLPEHEDNRTHDLLVEERCDCGPSKTGPVWPVNPQEPPLYVYEHGRLPIRLEAERFAREDWE